MMHIGYLFFFIFIPLTLSANQPILEESDPESFIQGMVNVINGAYSEVTTDLIIAGPDALVLQRYYTNESGWKIFPERFLVVGKDPSKKSCMVGDQHFEWSLALAQERSGAILPYSGWRNANGNTQDPLTIDVLNQAIGMVNTYAKDINGQTNHKNNKLYCFENVCELILGDGTRRIYQSVKALPYQTFGEEITQMMRDQVLDPSCFLLTKEILPSGNQIFFSYDEAHHLTNVEMKNASNKILSWIHFSYQKQKNESLILIKTSDDRELIYHFLDNHLSSVTGTHVASIHYEYDKNLLVKKILPEERFVEIIYQNGKVEALKGPNAHSGLSETAYCFSYENNHTDVFDAHGTKTRYIYDKRFQLIAIEYYDHKNDLYRIEQKFWGKTKSESGLLLAKTIGDKERIYSYRSFEYDTSYNVIEEKLYGNLTGKEEVALEVSSEGKLLNSDEEECHVKTFGYSNDGFNLLIKVGDCKGNRTIYTYQTGTNLLIKKLVYDNRTIKKRTFRSYNEDAVCIKIIEDDGSHESETEIYGWCVTERHIQEIQPKMALPGVGLPIVIQEKVLDLKTRKEVLVKKLVNTYDPQSHLIGCETYDANGDFAFKETRTYTHLGQVSSQKDGAQKEVFYTYDGVGNETSRYLPYENKFICTIYNFQNKPIQIIENGLNASLTLFNSYDALGRKTSSTDRYGNTTSYEYDAFHRLIKITHPEVLDEHGKSIHPTFHYTYDIFGNAIELIDAKGFITRKSYTLRGDPTKIFHPDGSFEIFKYDPEGSLHRSLTRDKIITVYEYDYLGRSIYEESSTAGETGVASFLKSKSYQYNGFHCTYEKEDDHIKRYYFHPSGTLASIIEYGEGQKEKSPEARVTEFIYDSLGQVIQNKVWFDIGTYDYALECYSYDLAGNIVEKRIENALNTVLLQKFYTYNTQNQCEEEFMIKDGKKTCLVQTIHNSEGEPVGYVDGIGHQTKVILDHHFVNALNQTVFKKTLINPIGMQTEMEFDALGRLYTICKKDPFGILLSSQKFLYDALGNKAAEINDQVINGQIISSQKTEWVYGPMGRLEAEIKLEASNKTYYEYNILGKLISKDQLGMPIKYTYNKDGRLHKIESSSDKKEFQILNTYSYDRKGNITSAHSLHGKCIQRSYNPFNQIIKETIKDGEGSYSLEYSYDRKGRIKTTTLPDKSKITYAYDAAFCREIHRISQTGEVLYTHTYDSYDSQGNLLSENPIGDGGAHEYAYNLNGQKISNKSDFFHEEIVRDELRRIIEIKGEKDEHYLYNNLSQLISEKDNTHSYDSLDNRIQTNNEELIYNGLNQLISDSHTQFSYDAQGNLLRKVLDGEEIHYESNALSQLISIEKPDETTVNFSYDPFGRALVEKHFDTKGKNKKTLSTTRYLYFGYQEIGTLSLNGDIENLKILGITGEKISTKSIAFELKGETFLPLHDISGNVVRLIDPKNCQILERYEYTSFGQVSIFNSDGGQENASLIANPWQFAEKHFDNNSGLLLFGLRFYDPSIGRWISQDPLANFDGPNTYSYLHNNPLNHFDRFGLATETSSSKFDEYMYGEVETHCYCEKHRTCKRGGDLKETAHASLPKINYLSFEQLYPNYDVSRTFDLSEDNLLNLPQGLGIGFINGIWNDFNGSKESLRHISRLAGGYNIHAVFNATHGTCADLKECIKGLSYVATEPVQQLHKMWNNFFDNNSSDAKFLMICHSQGAIHVRNALLDYPPELREKILVVAIAPAAYIYQSTCAKVIHYRAELCRDMVPRFDQGGSQREHDSIITVKSHPDAALFDHEFMSPTYKVALRKHITRYIKSNGKT